MNKGWVERKKENERRREGRKENRGRKEIGTNEQTKDGKNENGRKENRRRDGQKKNRGRCFEAYVGIPMTPLQLFKAAASVPGIVQPPFMAALQSQENTHWLLKHRLELAESEKLPMEKKGCVGPPTGLPLFPSGKKGLNPS
ncbi:hypothetical protein L345_12897, partial [Ophiophagus hannah]